MGRRPLAFAVLGLMSAFLILSAFLQTTHAPATSGAAPQGTSVAVGSATTGTVAGGGNTQAGGAPAAGGPGTTIAATEKDFAIALDKASVPAGAVTFMIKNTGPSPHNIAVAKAADASKQKGMTGKAIKESESIDGGKSGTLTLDLQPGTYQVVCTIPGHIQLGMIIELTVT